MENTVTSSPPPEAPFSIGIILIPAEPVYSLLSQASLAIDREYDSSNIIDNDKFPTHLSLLLFGATEEMVDKLSSVLEHCDPGLRVQGQAQRIYTEGNGFIGVKLQSPDCQSVHSKLLNSVEQLLEKEPVLRPHLIRRWPRLGKDQQTLLLRYGSYHVEQNFRPHLSVAQVHPEDTGEASQMAKNYLTLPAEVKFEKIQIVDVGHQNEKWTVLKSLSLNQSENG